MNMLYQRFQQGNQNNNLFNQVSNLKNLGSSNAVFDRLYQSNPQFRQFADSMRGKTPEQAFRENGLDFNQFRSFRWQLPKCAQGNYKSTRYTRERRTNMALQDMSAADLAAVVDNDGGFGGSNGWWIILLFLFAFGGWGNGWGGGFGGGANGVTTDIGYNFDMHDVSSGIRDLASSNANGFYGLNTGMLTGFSNTQMQIANTGFDIAQAINAGTVAGLQNTNLLSSQLATHSADEQLCCCQTQGKIDAGFANLNYNLATEACADRAAVTTAARDIIDNANDNTRAILDFLVQDRISALQNENSTLKNQISQSEQNAYLINALRPSAEPAYIVANPYTGVYGTYGYNAMYGGPLTNGFIG